MSFSFDRPNMRDRMRGKSGDEYVEEMMKNLKQKNRKFFDSHPKWKTGFSFDDGLEREGSAGGSSSNLKTHLADLVARHPELADSFVGFLPEELGTRTKEFQESADIKEPPHNIQTNKHKPTRTTTQGTQTGTLESDIKLRNTVPDMQSNQSSDTSCDSDRSQRSQSAPPQTSSNSSNMQQKEEGIRLIPIRTDVPQSGQQIPPRPQQHYQNPPYAQQHFQQAPSQQYQHCSPQHFQQHQSPPDQRNQEEKGPTIRHIPIFVEGRDEPILPKDVPPTGMKRGGCQGKAESNSGKRAPQPQPEEKRQQQQQTTEPPQQQHHQQQQHAPPQPPSKPDPLAQVADILKEVEELSARVNEWKGNSRSEKEYIYLDEMLTRNLLKLDNIETEGREEVRTARKDVIRRIQAAISVLESKSAESSSDQNQLQAADEQMDSSDKNEGVAQTQTEPMDVEDSKNGSSQQSNQTSQMTHT